MFLQASDSSIIYSPPNAWEMGHNGAMTTSQQGATARFTFNGDLIKVSGTLPRNVISEPISTYNLDNETTLIFMPSMPRANQSTSAVFYESNPASGNHSLLITLTSGEQLALSTMEFTSSSEFASPSESSPVPSSSILSMPPTTPSSSSSSLSSKSGSLSKANIGGIVGGVISAVFILAVLVAVYVVCRRRKRRSTQHKADTPKVTPFVAKPRGSVLPPPVISTRDEKEPLPEVPGPSTNSRRGSMYKPKPDSNGLLPMEYGYGKGV